MTPEEYLALYNKCMEGRCTSAEQRALESYEDGFDLVSDEEWDPQLGDKQQIRRRIQARLHSSLEENTRTAFSRMWWVAASIVLILASILLYKKEENGLQKTALNEQLKERQQIKPGSKSAVLTLEDGTQIELGTADTGLLSNQGSMQLRKSADGTLVYSPNHISSETKIVYNTIEAPAGAECSFVLSDGTKVWLNAGSVLKFPTAFQSPVRRVELSGEGYFEVAENKQYPFIVNADDTQIKVLGTIFNISAYKEDGEIETTLIKGSVKVMKGTKSAVLVPGQQASARKNTSGIEVRETDVFEAQAWKNGYFIFDDEPLEAIMKKVSRWYNVEVEYQSNMKSKRFGVSVSKFKDISELLNVLEMTGDVSFKVKGRRIIVLP